MSNNVTNVAFVGNPNCGKTTLFNAYTGAKLKVANWPGVTVEKKEGFMTHHNDEYKLVDLPGTYALTCYTMEEKLTREYIMNDEVDVIIDVADASALEKSLYLTLQLIELGKPVVMALNMMDIVEKRGMEIDLHRLPEMLGIPVIPVSARRRTGLDVLIHAVAHHKDSPYHKIEHHHKSGKHIHKHHDEFAMVYSDDIEDKIDIISSMLKKKFGEISNLRWHSIKILEHDSEIMNKYPLDLSGIADESLEFEIINQKYNFIEEIIHEVVVNKAEKSQMTDDIDAVLTHRIWGLPVFLCIMALVFFLTFTVGDFIKIYFETALSYISDSALILLKGINAGNVLTSLIVDGIIAGVGGILTFLPNIFILFLALAFLEDSGYMSRVAYVMDGIMSKIGLSGRAFIPLLLGFGCSVPAIMATRALEHKRDKLKTIIATPFMSCSARLPIYVLFSEIFFPDHAFAVAFSMYIIGLIVAITVLLIMDKADGENEPNTLLIELPEYKSPSARTVFIYVWEKIKDYLSRAGTTIFVASIVLWFLLNFNAHGMVSDITQGFASSIGRVITPALSTAGLGYWQIAVALISGIAAKEVVASSMSVIFGIANIASAEGQALLSASLTSLGFTAVNAYSLMLFCLLYVPCIATIATIRRETNSAKWTLFAITLQLFTAWFVSTLFYQIATLIIR